MFNLRSVSGGGHCAQDRCLSRGIKNDFPQKSFFSCRKKTLVFFFDFETNQLPHDNVLAVPACSLSLDGTTDVIHSCGCIFLMHVPARRLGASNHTSKVCIKPRCLSQSDWTISPCLAFCSLTTAVSAFCAVLRGENCVFFSKGQRKLNDCISKVESYPPQLSGIEMRSRHVATNVQGS